MGEVWTRWEGQVVNGAYPLRRFLNASDHSAVFLTESGIEGFFNAAIKLIPADPGVATDVQLWQWKTAVTITHPHLMRLLDSGQWEVEGRRLLFVVMEYAEETLAQVLPYRALVSDEVRELLVPTLDALAFLHRESWIQGQMKPTNFLVVNDQLKLAIDTIRPVGVARGSVVHPTPYDPPESERGESSPAADVWGLGVTLVEALTQYPPTWPGGRSEPPVLRASVPSSFEDIIQQCLSVDPADRPTVADLQLHTKPGSAAQHAAAGASSVSAPVAPASSAMASPSAASGATVSAGMATAGAAIAGVTDARVATSATGAAAAAGAMAGRSSATSAARARDADAAVMEVAEADSSSAAVRAPAYAPTSAPAGREIGGPVPSGAAPNRAAAASESIRAGDSFARPSSYSSYSQESAGGKHRFVVPAIAVVVVIFLAIWGGTRLFRTEPEIPVPPPVSHMAPNTSVSPSETDTKPPPQSSAPVPSHAERQPLQAAANGTANVVHEELPKASLSARQTIRGHVRVAIRVTVDKSGKVVHDRFENASSSNYFNRIASEAARKWKFTAADNESAREWLLHFEFGREGTTVRATRSRS